MTADVFWLVILALTFTSIGILLGRIGTLQAQQRAYLAGLDACRQALSKHPEYVTLGVVQGIEEAMVEIQKGFQL